MATSLTANIVTSTALGVAAVPVHPDKGAGNTFVNNAQRTKFMMLIVNNSADQSITGTFVTTGVKPETGCDLPLASDPVTVGSGAAKTVGPFGVDFENATVVTVNWSGAAEAADVDLYLLRVP
jgi:hypothetical protein